MNVSKEQGEEEKVDSLNEKHERREKGKEAKAEESTTGDVLV